MIRHIVSWRLSAEDDAGKDLAAAEITAALHSLPPVIPEILALTVGRNVANPGANYDLVLVSDYASLADLEAYLEHPAHKAVGALVRERVSERASVDVEL